MLIHLSPALAPVDLERMLVAAESLRMLDRLRLAELMDEHRGEPGIHKLVPLLEKEPAIVKSDLELLTIPVVHEAGVPTARRLRRLVDLRRDELAAQQWPLRAASRRMDEAA